MSSRSHIPLFRDEAEIETLVRDFRHCTLAKEDWNHRAHLAAAMWFLAEYPCGWAEALFIAALHRFNLSIGTTAKPTGGYNETLTRFWLAVGRGVRDAHPGASLLDLVNRYVRVPQAFASHFYSDDLLRSREARRRWVAPDLVELDDVEECATISLERATNPHRPGRRVARTLQGAGVP